MKLKRIISALIVFTLVMTSALCSVSAAEYRTTTSYNISTGDLTISASISGATDGSMISYIIYGDDDSTTKDDITERNIVHIDQATVSGNSVKFDPVTTDYDSFKNRKIVFQSNDYDDELTAWNRNLAGDTYAKSVDEINSLVKSAVFNKDTGLGIQEVGITYIKDDGDVIRESMTGPSLGGAGWTSGDPVWKEPDERTSNDYLALIPISGVESYIIDVTAKEGRPENYKFYVQTGRGSFNGSFETKAVVGKTLYATGTVNSFIDGVYKENVKDGNFAGLDLVGGEMYIIKETANKTAGTTTTDIAMTLPSKPIVGKHNGYDSVTFLAKVSNTKVGNNAGLKIYKYPKGTVSSDNTAVPANTDPEVLGVYRRADHVSGSGASDKYFGIMLFDGADSGALKDCDFVAVPVIYDSEDENSDYTELNTFGDTTTGYFYATEYDPTSSPVAEAE